MTEPAQSSLSDKFLSLKETAEILGVTIETLLEWNDNNILKPTITTSGDVVYTQGQIDKFISIQKLHDASKTTQTITNSLQLGHVPEPVDIPVQNKSTGTEVFVKKDKQESGGKLKMFGTLMAISFLTVILLTVFYSHQKSANAPVSQEALSPSSGSNSIEADAQKNTKGVNILKPYSNTESTPLTNKNIVNNIEDNNSTAKNVLNEEYLSDTPPASAAADVSNNVQLPPVLGVNAGGTTSNFSSRPNQFNGKSSVFDDNGNIKDETVTQDTLATTLASNGFESTGTPYKQSIYPTLLALGLLFTIFVFVTQPSLDIGGKTLTQQVPLNISVEPLQKVLEISQKPDGSVVLYFQGDEHKISKPELNSETDQFIQRLMSFATNNKQEINYNILKDEKVRLNAPLSKLVTRLGFVGLKRDLFFPRTSKNRVIFRKYLTHQDLLSLGLTPNRITEELLN